jgi:lysophospholipase L1-like esterase
VGELYPPRLRPGETAIANVWIPGGTAGLTDENLYVIEHTLASRVPEGESVAERLLPRTLAKLRNGESVRIVSWGDSVTCGGGVNQEKEKWYQYQFLGRLRERFPQAEIELLTAGWGGASSRQYMDAPAGGQHDFQRDVLDPKPDLITIEFVNDAYLKGDAFVKHYDEIMAHLETTGAEVVLITPHYVRPDWMGVETQKVSDDPRPYVASLRAYARERSIALADASRKWGLLWRQGLPYMTLLANSINHPDARGHALFADALMELFPAE